LLTRERMSEASKDVESLYGDVIPEAGIAPFPLALAGLSGCLAGFLLAGEFVEVILILLMLAAGLGLGWTVRGLLK